MERVQDLQNPLLDSLMLFVTGSAEIWVLVPVGAIFVWLWRQNETTTPWLLLASTALGSVVSRPLKGISDRPRPDFLAPLVTESSSSFPSGHTLAAVCAYGFIAVVLWRLGHRTLALFSALWVVLVGFSRVYLGVHYPTDVIASFMIGTALLIGLFAVDNLWRRSIADSGTASDTVHT